MCLNPITIRVDNSQGLRSIQVPCGKCLDCLKRYQNDWMLRLTEESTNWTKFSFITLTYRPDTVPFYVDSRSGETFNTVCKKHIQDWLKRFRTRQAKSGLSLPFKYFITSEYGPRTLRPHYHALFFGLSVDDLYTALCDWRLRYGFVYASDVKTSTDDKQKVCYYVSKYCSKGFFDNPRIKECKVDKCFKLISKRVGASYVRKMRDFHLGNGFFSGPRFDSYSCKYTDAYINYVYSNKNVRRGEFSYHMPRYFSEKIYGTKNILSSQIADFLFKLHSKSFDYSLRLILTQNPSMSFSQAFNSVVMSSHYSNIDKEKHLRQTLGVFYDKSKL